MIPITVQYCWINPIPEPFFLGGDEVNRRKQLLMDSSIGFLEKVLKQK